MERSNPNPESTICKYIGMFSNTVEFKVGTNMYRVY